MTVEELIKELQTYPGNLPVRFALPPEEVEILSIYSNEGLYPAKEKATCVWIVLE